MCCSIVFKHPVNNYSQLVLRSLLYETMRNGVYTSEIFASFFLVRGIDYWVSRAKREVSCNLMASGIIYKELLRTARPTSGHLFNMLIVYLR